LFIDLDATGITRPSLTHLENQFLPQSKDKTVSFFWRWETQHNCSPSAKPLRATARQAANSL